jgi:medium-chain acyl-[acyl-carrier-protein] hydrolase
MSDAEKRRWLVRARPVPNAALRLFCLPYAGAGASLFAAWAERLPRTWEVCAVQLPGREGRFREPAYSRIGPLVRDLADALDGSLDSRFALFGHSFGGLVAFELARELRRRGLPGPDHLLVSGRAAPQLSPRRRPIHALPEPEFREELRRLDGTPAAVLDHDELMQLFSSLLRADFAALETYAYQDEPPLECPIAAFGGIDDARVNIDELNGWKTQTSSAFALHRLPGGHFFLQSARDELLALIGKALSAQEGRA